QATPGNTGRSTEAPETGLASWRRRNEQLLQFGKGKYLVDAGVETGRLCTGKRRVVEIVSAHHHELHLLGGKSGAQCLRNHEAVLLRHADIQQHEVGLPALRELERLFAVACALDIVTEILQEVGQRFAYCSAVIGDKHAPAAIPGSAADRSAPGRSVVFRVVSGDRGVCVSSIANASFGLSD